MTPRPRAILRGLRLSLRGLRTRTTLLLMAGLLFCGAGFEALLTTMTWRGEHQELESRARSLARIMSERAVTPVVVNDLGELRRQTHRAVTEPDIVGAAIYPAHGPALAQRALDRALWTGLDLPDGRLERGAVSVVRRRVATGEVLDVVAPILRGTARGGSLAEAGQVFGLGENGPPPPAPPVGWVRLVASTERANLAVRDAARMGLILLLLAAVLGFFAVSLFVGFVIRPLREAGGLAREIASGQLDRRLPVRSADELGDLAGSMNTMAAALHDARQRAEAEAEALRTATAAMLSIARGARAAHDPHSIFGMVAHEVKRVTRAGAVALAVPPPDAPHPVFEHFEPPAPWAGLAPGQAVPEEILERLRGLEGGALRLASDPDHGACPGLELAGFRAVLLVPLQLPGSPPALLLAASVEAGAFPAQDRDVVVALASHLSSALHAGRLQERLEDAFAELQRTHDYLVHSEMLRVAGEMASGVAHDINNVLGAVLGRTQLLARRLEAGTLSTEELLTSLRVIERAAQDGRETGRRLRQFGHVAPGAATEAVNLHEILKDAVEFTRPRWQNEAHAAGLVIELEMEFGAAAWVAGRASELREVFTNLILNAVDALPHGGTIRLESRVEGPRVMATVTDDGVGMDDETARRLFEPFFTTKGDGGTGLGLSVVYGIVQRHGGTIAVHTRAGRGTRMEVSLPLAAAPERPARVAETTEEMPVLDVLVVDDEEPVREVLRDIAVAYGQRATSCGSGAEALRLVRPGAFQLVMTDLGMPGMTGWELARRLRALDPDVAIVFVTGWGEDVDARAATEAGADLVLAKPFNFDDVARAIRLAAQRRERREAA